MSASFFFYDYETTGIDPQRDRIIQFAGIRTDKDFEIIAEPVAEYCKLSLEVIPNLEALLVTGIDHKTLEKQGLNEVEFNKLIYQEFSKPETCVAGYNNIRFDDEFTRYSFYRNFYDPYAREWQSNNSRWDLIDVVRMCAALRPDGIEWPISADNKPSFKLEELTKANGLTHYKAHDALSDVYATIDFAKLIKSKQPKLLNYLLNCRKKNFVQKIINLEEKSTLDARLIVHSSRMINSIFYATSIFLPLCKDPVNPNGYICWDLRHDPNVLLNLGNDLKKAKYLLYTPEKDLQPGEQRLALKNIFANKVPAIAPVATVDSQSYDRIQLDKDIVYKRAEQLIGNISLWQDMIIRLYSEKNEFKSSDVEHQLYDKFISDSDKKLCVRVHFTPEDKLRELESGFSDQRLKELLFRYRARNYYFTLDKSERLKWQEFCMNRLNNINELATLSKTDFITKANQYILENKKLSNQGNVHVSSINLIESWLKYIENVNFTDS